jgi:hypothetical protein
MLVLLVAACGQRGDNGPAPSNLEHACAILDERPEFRRAFRASERRWGVPMQVQMAVIYQESKFISDARTPFRYTLGVIPMGRQSSAYGYSQALDGTWDEYREDTGRRAARRDDIHDAADFMGWYMAVSSENLGISLSDTRSQYLAYHEGRTGFKRGTYNGKPWLLRITDEVDARAQTYGFQLQQCGGRPGFVSNLL